MHWWSERNKLRERRWWFWRSGIETSACGRPAGDDDDDDDHDHEDDHDDDDDDDDGDDDHYEDPELRPQPVVGQLVSKIVSFWARSIITVIMMVMMVILILVIMMVVISIGMVMIHDHDPNHNNDRKYNNHDHQLTWSSWLWFPLGSRWPINIMIIMIYT